MALKNRKAWPYRGSIFFLSAIVLILLLQTTGCMQMIMDAGRSSKPTYQETVSEWPEIQAGEGRVVIYWPPPKPFREVMNISVDGEKDKSTALYYKTFIFIDLKAGKHIVQQASWGKRKEVANFDLQPGETVYVRLGDAPGIATSDDLIPQQHEIYHHFKKPLPFNVQK